MHGRGAGRSPENFGGKLLSLGEILHSKNASHCVGKLIMQCIHFCKGYILIRFTIKEMPGPVYSELPGASSLAWLVHSMGSLVRHIVILPRLGLLELWRPLLMPTPDGW